MATLYTECISHNIVQKNGLLLNRRVLKTRFQGTFGNFEKAEGDEYFNHTVIDSDSNSIDQCHHRGHSLKFLVGRHLQAGLDSR